MAMLARGGLRARQAVAGQGDAAGIAEPARTCEGFGVEVMGGRRVAALLGGETQLG